jgi:hypothetical protein
MAMQAEDRRIYLDDVRVTAPCTLTWSNRGNVRSILNVRGDLPRKVWASKTMPTRGKDKGMVVIRCYTKRSRS